MSVSEQQVVRAVDEYDAVIVGASLAGCASAILLGRAGLKVALIERRLQREAFKRVCSHYIQSSAIATLERMNLLEPMMKAGAVRSRAHFHTSWGWIDPPAKRAAGACVNLRRSVLDPLVREHAAATSGVDLMLGLTARELLLADGGDRSSQGRAVRGVSALAADGSVRRLSARLVIGADGRGSRIAKLAGLPRRTWPNARFAYGGYFQGPAPERSPDATVWFLDPNWAAAFPTDEGLTFYAAMPTAEHLARFRADPEAALREYLQALPEAPPVGESELICSVDGTGVVGKIDMTNVRHSPTAPGLALVGDAALAIDPLFGVGCGWALQSAEWLVDSVTPALCGSESLKRGLARYRRVRKRRLRGYERMIVDYSSGRAMDRGERMIFSAAVRSERVARTFEAFGTRNIGSARMLGSILPSAMAVNARAKAGGMIRAGRTTRERRLRAHGA